MHYFAVETCLEEGNQKNAGSKARADVEALLEENAFRRIPLPALTGDPAMMTLPQKLQFLRRTRKAYLDTFSFLEPGDVLLLQMPFTFRVLLQYDFLKPLREKNVQILQLVHDLEMLRGKRAANGNELMQRLLTREELRSLRLADSVIVHNRCMLRHLAALGIPEANMIPLGLFDYLIPEEIAKTAAAKQRHADAPVMIAGNLSPEKAGFLYHLPGDVCFDLFGNGFEGTATDRIRYRGTFPPEELPLHLDGGFGLVWDGDSPDTCAGTFGEYMRINNPHKTSLYLACGIPVIIWKEAALAEFVTAHSCGLVIGSLAEIAPRIRSLHEKEYAELQSNARRIGTRLRDGHYLKSALGALRGILA